MQEFTYNTADTTSRKVGRIILDALKDGGWNSRNDGDDTFFFDADRPEISVKVTAVHRPGEQTPPIDEYAILQTLQATPLEEVLGNSVPAGITVDKVIIGYNWTMVRAGQLCGIARSPQRGTTGARTIRPPEGFAGVELAQLAELFKSVDPLKRSLGLAAINTFWNRPDADYIELTAKGDFAAVEPPGTGTIIIGAFRGVLQRLPEARIVELEPQPGDIPAQEAQPFIKKAEILAITAQTLMNGSLELLRRTFTGTPGTTMLTGPSAPLCPQLLECGIDQIDAVTVIDPDATERFILESGTMIMLPELVKRRYLQKSASATTTATCPCMG